MLYAFFWVIPGRLNFIFRRFGTLCLFHSHGHMKIEETDCSETWAYKIQKPGNYPEESIQHEVTSFLVRLLPLDFQKPNMSDEEEL